MSGLLQDLRFAIHRLNRDRCVTLLSILALSLGCVPSLVESGLCQAVTKSHDATRIIRGIVVNKLTGEPISRALVFSRDNRLGMLTDDSGRFEFTISTLEKPSDAEIFFSWATAESKSASG